MSRGHAAPARLLLEHPGIEIDARADYYGRTALNEAARHGYIGAGGAAAREGGGREPARQDRAELGADRGDQEPPGQGDAVCSHRAGRIDFADKEARLNALIWAGSSGNSAIRDALDMTIRDFFERDRRSAAFAG